MLRRALDTLARSNLTGSDYKVFLKLASLLNSKIPIIINQAELAREMKLSRQSFNRSMMKLLAINVILEGSRINANRSYLLNSDFDWKDN